MKKRKIRDYKFGGRISTNIQLENDIQFTLYILGVGSVCYFNPEFTLEFGVDLEEARTWAGNPIFLSHSIDMERFTMWYRWNSVIKDGKIVNEKEIFVEPRTTHRVDAQFDEFCNTLDDLESKLIRGMETKNPRDFSVNRKSCKWCLFPEECKKVDKGQIPIQGVLFPPPREKPQTKIEQASFLLPKERPKTETEQLKFSYRKKEKKPKKKKK